MALLQSNTTKKCVPYSTHVGKDHAEHLHVVKAAVRTPHTPSRLESWDVLGGGSFIPVSRKESPLPRHQWRAEGLPAQPTVIRSYSPFPLKWLSGDSQFSSAASSNNPLQRPCPWRPHGRL